MSQQSNRRQWLGSTAAFLGAATTATATARTQERAQEKPAAKGAAVGQPHPFTFGLNTSTLRGHELPLPRIIELASKAGYTGIEPWIREIDQYVEAGGSLRDLRRALEDAGLSVESAIGFPEWSVDDPARRAKGLEEARRNMELLQSIGGKRIAAPPVGMTDVAGADLNRLAERYRALLELGDRMGIVPEIEVWGFSKTLGRLSDVAYVAIQAGHPQACILPDVFHLYKGGSSFEGLKLLSGRAIPAFHMNDYPAGLPREQANDGHRVYPGDGAAPMKEILRTLLDIGFRGMLSLELFNKEHWAQDPAVVARTGLEKMKAAVRAALA